jgi:hypothetical protein
MQRYIKLKSTRTWHKTVGYGTFLLYLKCRPNSTRYQKRGKNVAKIVEMMTEDNKKETLCGNCFHEETKRRN